jgi:hypothetical protein
MELDYYFSTMEYSRLLTFQLKIASHERERERYPCFGCLVSGWLVTEGSPNARVPNCEERIIFVVLFTR